MKLILHIGTHKTGTSSLQNFLKDNSKVMMKHGIYYPLAPNGKKNFNNIAQQLAEKSLLKITKLFEKIYIYAQKKSTKLVVISAESFYAMTYFYSNKFIINKKKYFRLEEKKIRNLKKICKIFKEIQIICYLRPQIDFAHSIYNQEIKDSNYKHLNFKDYIEFCPELFDFNSHLEIFEKIFGKKNVKCFNFFNLNQNIIEHFCVKILKNNFYKQTKFKNYRENIRLNERSLKYKRVFNKIIKDKALHFIVKSGLIMYSKRYPDKFHNIYLKQNLLKKFFNRYKIGNKKIFDKYKISNLNLKTNFHKININKMKKDSLFLTNFYLKNWIMQPKNFISYILRKFYFFIIKNIPFSYNFFETLKLFIKYINYELKNYLK